MCLTEGRLRELGYEATCSSDEDVGHVLNVRRLTIAAVRSLQMTLASWRSVQEYI